MKHQPFSGTFKFRSFKKTFLFIILSGSFLLLKAQINYNPSTCFSNPFKFNSSIGDSARTYSFASFSAGYRIRNEGDTCFAMGNLICIQSNAMNSIGLGHSITLNYLAKNAYAIGNTIGVGAINAFAIGSFIKSNYSNTITIGLGTINNVLMNAVPGSLMLSMNSQQPSIFVANGNSTGIGNVGIGTTSPGSQLQVNGGCAIGYINSTVAPPNGLLVSGNTGIGTTGAITEKLQVNGAIRLQTTTAGNSENGSLIWDGADLLLRKNNNWESLLYESPWDTSMNVVTTNRNVGIGVENPSMALEINGYVKLHQKKPLMAPDGSIMWSGTDFLGRKNGIWVSLTGVGTGEWIKCSNGIFTNSLRVGINTVPEATLHIKSFENPLIGIVPATIRLETDLPSSSSIAEIKNDNSGALAFLNQQKLLWQLTPEKSQVNNQLFVSNTLNPNYPDLVIKREGLNNYPVLCFEHSYENGGGGGGGNTETIVTDSYEMINKNNFLTIRSVTSSNPSDIISFAANRVTIPVSTVTRIDGRLALGCEPVSNNRLTVTGTTVLNGDLSVNGNIGFTKYLGIGTPTPLSPIHIKGPVTEITLENTNNTPPNESSKVVLSAANGCGRIISDKEIAFFIDADNNQTNEGLYVVSNSGYFGGNYSYLMWVKNDGSYIANKMTVGGNTFVQGNIGIGMEDTKGYRLAVDGSILTEKVKVVNDAMQWPDLVFESEYKLLSIPELKNYIELNNKLPDIPSALDVKKNGIELGEMNSLLLKKIEELTLYIIQQDEKINALEEQNKLILEKIKN